jgi:hypothetical protein
MKNLFLIATVLFSCGPKKQSNPMNGTWKLIRGTIIENGKTTVTDYTLDQSFIKVINDDHFVFLLHDLTNGTDSVKKVFSAGGGPYTLVGNKYTEHLEYCNDRTWENHDFTFQISFSGDTLVQQGVEKVGDVERMNVEKYVRIGR